jgi:hypothetical protein
VVELLPSNCEALSSASSTEYSIQKIKKNVVRNYHFAINQPKQAKQFRIPENLTTK